MELNMDNAEALCSQTVGHISDTIKSYRGSNRLSLDDLAKRSGVSRSMICQIEAGKAVPTVQVLTKLASGMNTSLSALIEGRGSAKQIAPKVIKDLDRSLSADGAFSYRMLSQSGCRKVEVREFEFLKMGVRVEGPNPCGTLATLIVQSGTLVLNVQGEQIPVAAGQTLEFRASREYSLEQTTESLASGLLITAFG
jgi:transcriptional regulator with XRE-family HTH domain